MAARQNTLMTHCPATGDSKPYPSHAEQYRDFHGMVAWLYNPWTGEMRDPRDIGTDTFGHLIVPPGEPVFVDATGIDGVAYIQLPDTQAPTE